MAYANGDRYDGQWEAQRRVGTGRMKSADGVTSEGVFKGHHFHQPCHVLPGAMPVDFSQLMPGEVSSARTAPARKVLSVAKAASPIGARRCVNVGQTEALYTEVEKVMDPINQSRSHQILRGEVLNLHSQAGERNGAPRLRPLSDGKGLGCPECSIARTMELRSIVDSRRGDVITKEEFARQVNAL
jgi:hypothetical protein